MLDLLLSFAVAISTTITLVMLALPTRYVQQAGQMSREKSSASSTASEELLSGSATGSQFSHPRNFSASKASKASPGEVGDIFDKTNSEFLSSNTFRHSPSVPTQDMPLPNVSVQVLVLGDIGRSPRMQYHAMSIAKHGGQVYLIGYNEIVNNPRITIVPLSAPPAILRSSSLPFILVGPLKVLFQIYTLFQTLLYTLPATRFLLVQNPPSIPVLAIAFVASFLRNTHLLIDWHNYGYTILSAKLPTSHPLVRISRTYEHCLGRWAPFANFTVTHAMARQLKEAPWGIHSPIVTLHDRPAEIFQPITSSAKRREFLSRLAETKDSADKIMAGKVKLVVSSTSWTPDEDFSILLQALQHYSDTSSAPILAIITGKGPDKAKYLEQIRLLTSAGKLGQATIKTAWLSIEDYATLLACADLGVCLHMSSSGVDLPMKVVDMFGAGLPVAGYSGYESWAELVREGDNGRGFQTAGELFRVLVDLFGSEEGTRKLQELRSGALHEGERRWDDEWDEVAGRVMGFVD